MSLRCGWRKEGMFMTFGESTSGKSWDFEYEGHWLWGVVPGDGTEEWGEYIWGEKREEVMRWTYVPLHWLGQTTSDILMRITVPSLPVPSLPVPSLL
jgi:hypothetical protein